MESEVQLITLKKFKSRAGFDFRGMHSKMKRAFTYVHRMEDVWIDLRNNVHIIRMDFCRLTLRQIIDLDLVPIPEGVEGNDMILDKQFHDRQLEKLLPIPIQWQQKETILIFDIFQTILMNINSWLKTNNLKRIKLRVVIDCSHFGPIGRNFKLS